MSNNNPTVRYKCTSANCRHEGQTVLGDLVGGGCQICGSKRLEIWHPTKGHVLIDYRSPKSARKQRRQRRESAVHAME